MKYSREEEDMCKLSLLGYEAVIPVSFKLL